MTKVLILEDDLVDQMALTRLFDKKIPEAQVTICSNTKDANQQLNLVDFDWVISDFNLPDGTLQDILHHAKNLKMICVSGELGEEKISALKAKGLFKYLMKDQHLNYLETIFNDISHKNEHQQAADAPNAKVNDLMTQLEKHFDRDNKAKTEVLEIFLDHVAGIDIPLLSNAIKHKEGKKLKHLSHKIQSSFRMFGAMNVIQILQILEEQSEQTTINWKEVNSHGLRLEILFTNYIERAQVLLKLLKNKNL